MKSNICCWRVVSLRSAIRDFLSLVRTCVRNSKGAVGRQQVFVQESAQSRTQKGERPRFHEAFRVRPRGFEPPPRNCRTRPSTWRVYQFRHRREWRSESSRGFGGRELVGSCSMHEHLLPSDRPLTVPNTCSNEERDSDGRHEADDAPAADL